MPKLGTPRTVARPLRSSRSSTSHSSRWPATASTLCRNSWLASAIAEEELTALRLAIVPKPKADEASLAPRLLLLAPESREPAQGIDCLLQRRRIIAAVIDDWDTVAIRQPNRVGNFFRRDHVGQPHCYGIDIERMCDEVHEALYHERRLGPPGAAIGCVGRFVGGDDGDRDIVVGYVVRAKQMHGSVNGSANADRHVSARIFQQSVADRKNAPPVIESDLDLMTVVACMCSVENMLVPIFDPFHWSHEAAREIGDQYVLRINVSLDPKTAADVRRDAAHARLRQSETGSDLSAHPMHDLRRRPDRHRVGSAVVLGNDTAALDRHPGVAMIVEAVAQRAHF